MKRILWLGVPLAVFGLACGAPNDKSCEKTGCSAGSTCNAATGQCEVTMTGGGGGSTGGGGGATGGGGGGDMDGGTGGGGGSTGGGGGSTGGGGGATGGGGGSVVDPLNDGGVFAPGAICSFAIPVNFVAGDGGLTATVNVDLTDAGDDYDPSCVTSTGGEDLVFALTLPQEAKLTVTATNTSAGTQDPVISLVREPCPTQQTVACVDDTASTSPEVLEVSRVPAGTWYVVLDNYSSSSTSGTYSVQFDLGMAVPGPANDTCSAPIALTPNASQTVDLTNSLLDGPWTCRTPPTGDLVYSFTTTQAQKVTITLDGTADFADGVLMMLDSPCATGAQRACLDAEGGSTPEKLVFNSLPAGTYYLFVAGYGSDDLDYGLTLALDPPATLPANDTCAAPEVVTLTAGTATVTAALENGNPDYTSPDPDCADGSAGNDLVYQVEIPAMQTLTVVATPTASDPVLFASTGTCFAPTLVCLDDSGAGSAESLTVPNTTAAPVTAYIIVKSYDANAEPVTLTFTAM
jgi:hypothetical protein